MVMTIDIDNEIQLEPASSNEGGVVPEGRYTLELVRVEIAPPSDFTPEDGNRIKWVFNLYAELVEGLERGTLFEFSGNAYEFYRHTSKKNSPKAYARMYAEALMGRKLADREVPKLGPLVGHRMSAMISYDPDPNDATRLVLKMSGLRPIAATAAKPASSPSPTQVSADPSSDDIDRALIASKLEKKIATAVKRKSPNHKQWAELNLSEGDISFLREALDNLQDELDAMDD